MSESRGFASIELPKSSNRVLPLIQAAQKRVDRSYFLSSEKTLTRVAVYHFRPLSCGKYLLRSNGPFEINLIPKKFLFPVCPSRIIEMG